MRNPLHSLSQAKQLHALLLVTSSSSSSSSSSFLYNSLIRAYARARHFTHAFSLFSHLLSSPSPRPDGFTFATVLLGCSVNSDIPGIRIIHSLLFSLGFSFALIPITTLIAGYSRLGLLHDAVKVFDEMPKPDLVLYNSMITGFRYEGGRWRSALVLFRRMRVFGEDPDGFSLVGLFSCFRDPESVPFARALHGFVLKAGFGSNPHVRSVLVSVYSRLGCPDSSYRIFREVSCSDMVTWSAVIAGFSQAGKWKEALGLFGEMNGNGLSGKPDSVLIASVISACASLAAVRVGKEVHGYVFRMGMDLDVVVLSALINLYSKCGFANHGFRVFEMIADKNSVTYNSVISGLGANGLGHEALGVFNKMLENGCEPDKATFSAILCACAHSGLLEEGMSFFRRMSDEFGIEAEMEHYVYMVRLMGLFGKLDEALELIEGMPKLPGSVSGVWGALLWGCGLHGRSDLCEIAGRRLFEIEPTKGAYRVMLSNMYASEEKWGGVNSLRDGLMGGAVKKVMGVSWIGDCKG